MPSDKTIKKKLEKLQKKRANSLLKNIIVISLICTTLAVGFTWLELRNAFLFTALSFLPSIASILWDKKPGRFASKTVSAFNLTGMFPYLIAIGSSGSPDIVARNTMQDPLSWVLIYGFAMFGWGVIYLVPQITLIFLEAKSKFMIKKMETFQQELLDEWGDDIKKF